MRAILIATGGAAGDSILQERYLSPLLPVLNRPIVQHVVETAVAQGIDELDVVLCHAPEEFKRLLDCLYPTPGTLIIMAGAEAAFEKLKVSI